MDFLYVLKPGYLDMAIDEIKALCPSMEYARDGNLLISAQHGPWSSRLALTRSVHQILATGSPDKVEQVIESIEWRRVSSESSSFYVNVHNGAQWNNARVAALVAKPLGNPQVDVKNPDVRVDCFFTAKQFYVTRTLRRDEQRFADRRAHLRPAHHPSSLHPMIARACVNLTGAMTVIVDPMCGAGGFLIEAGLMGLDVVGFDIDVAMIRRARTNLDHFRIGGRLEHRDALGVEESFDCLVADLPYGRSTKSVDRGVLYPAFLSWCKSHVTKRLVLVFPHYANWETYCKDAGLSIVSVHDLFVHKTLTRKIVILEP